ncbi:reticulocyte binding/rhoptry protein [Candidatus Hepatincola sp. Av]
MSLKVNFFPLHFIVSILALIAFVIVFSDTVYTYMSSNIYINGVIITLFVICMLWILGVLSYYSRSTTVINRLFTGIVPLTGRAAANPDNRKRSLYVASSIAGTLIDNPITSKVLSQSARVGRLDISQTDADAIVDSVLESGDRVLGPSKFLTSIFTMLGLFGTFIGLLQTIDGVGKALASLSDAQNVDVFALVRLLSDPLQGMSVAFSTSLFGLVGSLFGNYGNFVASQKLSILSHKLKNFLMAASTSVVKEDGVLEAQDLLLILEDSFSRLNVSLTERLDSLGENVIAMARVIARGQDRQDKVNKVMIGSFANLEDSMADFNQSMKKLSMLGNIGLDIMRSMTANKEDLMDYLDTHVVKYLQRIEYLNNKLNELSSENIDVSADILGAVQDVDDSVVKTDGSVKEATDVIEDVGSSLQSTLRMVNDSVLNNVDATLNVADSVQSVELTMQDVNDSAKNISEDVQATNSSVIKVLGVAGRVNESVLDVNDSVLRVFDSSENANNSLQNIQNALDDANNTNLDLNDGISAINNSILDSNDILSNASNAVLDVNDSVNAVNSSVLNSNDILSNASNAILDVNDSVNAVNNSAIAAVEGINLLGSLGEENNNLQNAMLNEGINTNMMLDLIASKDYYQPILDIVRAIDNGNELANEVAALLNNSNTMFLDFLNVAQDSNAISTAILDSHNEIANTNREMGNAFNDLSMSVSDISNVVASYVPAINDLVGSFKDDILGISEYLSGLNDTFINFTGALAENLDSVNLFTEVVSVLDTRMLELSNSLQEAVPQLSELVNTSSYNASALTELVESMNNLNASALEVSGVVNDFASTLLAENTNIAENVELLGQQIAVSTDTLSSSMGEVVDYFSNSAESNLYSSNLMAEAVERLSSFPEMVDQVVNNFESLRDLYASEVREFTASLSNGLETVMTTFDYLSNNMNNLDTLIDKFDSTVENNSATHLETLSFLRDNMGYLSESQGEFLNSFQSTVNDMSSGLSQVANELQGTLGSLNMNMSEQIEKITGLSDALSNYPELTAQFTYDIADKFSNLQTIITELTNNFQDVASSMTYIANEIPRQVEAIEANTTISDNLSSALTELAVSNNSLQGSSEILQEALSYFTNFAETMANLESVTTSREESFNNFAETAVSQFETMNERLEHFTELFMNKDSVIAEQTIEIFQNISSLLERFESFAADSIESNQDFKNQLTTSMESAVEQVKLIRENLGNNISERIIENLDELSTTQTGLLDSLNEIMPSISSIITYLQNEDSSLKNIKVDNSELLKVLVDLKDSHTNGNARLDVMANAVDALITEMLNSRDVTQSILDVVSKLATSNKV